MGSNNPSNQEPEKGLASKIKDGLRSKTAKLLMAGGLTVGGGTAVSGCNPYQSEVYMTAQSGPYYQYFNPYIFQRNNLFMINGARWHFSHFYPAQNMLYFYNYNGNSQIFFQISIGNLPNYHFQYYNPYNRGFVPFQRNDYDYYWKNRDRMRNHGRNYRHTPRINNEYPLDRDYQNNIQKQEHKKIIKDRRPNSKNRR